MMSITEGHQPVLSYAEGLPPVTEVTWRPAPAGEGYEFIVPPPPLVRILAGPSMVVILMTPLAAIGFVGIFASSIGGLGASLEVLPLLAIALTFILGWFYAVKRLVSVARHARKPFRLGISERGMRVTASPTHTDSSDTYTDHFEDDEDTRSVAKVRLSELSSGPFTRIAFLLIQFTQDDRVPKNLGINAPRGFYIPWPDRQPLIGWERQLQAALVRPRAST